MKWLQGYYKKNIWKANHRRQSSVMMNSLGNCSSSIVKAKPEVKTHDASFLSFLGVLIGNREMK
jgi:hypothetical protein